jgi:hypothetical protein
MRTVSRFVFLPCCFLCFLSCGDEDVDISYYEPNTEWVAKMEGRWRSVTAVSTQYQSGKKTTYNTVTYQESISVTINDADIVFSNFPSRTTYRVKVSGNQLRFDAGTQSRFFNLPEIFDDKMVLKEYYHAGRDSFLETAYTLSR